MQEFYIVFTMEATHIMSASSVRFVDLHLFVKPIVQHQAMRYRQPVRFHRVPGPIVEVPHVGIIKISNFMLSHSG